MFGGSLSVFIVGIMWNSQMLFMDKTQSFSVAPNGIYSGL